MKPKVRPKKNPRQSRRSPVKQIDVPGNSLAQALRVPRSIGDNYAYKPTTPLRVADAMGVQPGTGPFRNLCGSSIAYGLTIGGYNAKEIAITPLGMRIVRPTAEGDDKAAMREAVLKPKVVGDFLRKFDGNKVPRDDIAVNILHDMGVPQDRTQDVLKLIIENARDVGMLREINGQRYVDISIQTLVGERIEFPRKDEQELTAPEDEAFAGSIAQEKEGRKQDSGTDTRDKRRVFVAHGKNKSLLDPIKKLLAFGELEPVISTERTSVSQPVPDKVLSDMRGCGAAILHVDAELVVIDKEAQEHTMLNPNVLIEIGAAMALFGRRFILLVRDGVKLPTNLQGLFEVRYTSDTLDGDATIKLLEAINDIKKHPLP